MVYTIERHYKEYPDMEYRDGINIMFMYAYGKKNIPNQKVKDMLRFLVETTPENAAGDRDREAIYQMVSDIKNNRKVGAYYMKQIEILQMHHEEGREEGHEEERKLSAKVLRFYTLGKSSVEIADMLNISMDTTDDIIREFEEAQFNN